MKRLDTYDVKAEIHTGLVTFYEEDRGPFIGYIYSVHAGSRKANSCGHLTFPEVTAKCQEKGWPKVSDKYVNEEGVITLKPLRLHAGQNVNRVIRNIRAALAIDATGRTVKPALAAAATCTCTAQVLFNQGCICGSMKAYAPDKRKEK